MQPILTPGIERLSALRVVALLFVFALLLFVAPAWPNQHDMANMGAMHGMNHGDMTMPVGHESSEALAQQAAGKNGSEFNHHLAGLLVFLACIFVFAEEFLAGSWLWARYVWPICFLLAGLFVLIYSDLEIWPFGPQTPWYALTHSTEDLQHKAFAVILLSLGYVEFQRARGRLKGPWTALFSPVIAIAGAILLLFHAHGGDMTAPNAMETMQHIEKQHHWFAAAGFGIAVTKGLAEIPQRWQHIFRRTWPALLGVLGILLMVYTE
jgi:hypothetical protein